MAETTQNPKLRELIKAMNARLEGIIEQNDGLEDGAYIINEDGELEKISYTAMSGLKGQKDIERLSVLKDPETSQTIITYSFGDFRITRHEDKNGVYQTFTFSDITLPYSPDKLEEEELVFYIKP